MWSIIGIGSILLGVMLLVAGVPFALMMCAFVSASGKCSKRRFWAVFVLSFAAAAVEAVAMIRWGWGML